MKDKLRTFTSIWRTMKDGNTVIEEHFVDGKDYILCSGKVTINWKHIRTIEQCPLKLLEFLGYDISNIQVCTIITMNDGTFFYALEKFTVLEKEFYEYMTERNEYIKRTTDKVCITT